jgi:predicted secreted protein
VCESPQPRYDAAMTWSLGIALYFIIWWTLLFAVLPFGVQSQHEMKDIVRGSEPGAPARPRLGIKLLANTILAAVLWVVADYFYIRYYLHP